MLLLSTNLTFLKIEEIYFSLYIFLSYMKLLLFFLVVSFKCFLEEKVER